MKYPNDRPAYYFRKRLRVLFGNIGSKMMTCSVELFGRLTARLGDVTLTHFETRKTAALLALLALRPQRTHPRDELAEQLWPEEDWDATRNRLRQALAA